MSKKLTVNEMKEISAMATRLDQLGLNDVASVLDHRVEKQAGMMDTVMKGYQGARAFMGTKGLKNKALAAAVSWGAQDFANNIVNAVISKADERGESLGVDDIIPILTEAVNGLLPKFAQGIIGKLGGVFGGEQY